jgi:hypothetical protein
MATPAMIASNNAALTQNPWPSQRRTLEEIIAPG